ncbi:MAG: hypothetical protein HZA25_02700 [Candidatus Niyogibacteria bacterium]|nr:hypothetical protein [Candidatus Niyogibacteria bacterium]
MEQQKIESVPAEHAALQEKVSDIERIYAEATGEKKERHEAVAEALQEHLAQASQTHAPAYQITDDTAQTHAQDIAAHEDEPRRVRALLDLAHEKGIANAFQMAEKLHDPHLFDAFHDSFIKHHDEFLK